jgi:hypothetical protein
MFNPFFGQFFLQEFITPFCIYDLHGQSCMSPGHEHRWLLDWPLILAAITPGRKISR